MKGDRINYIKKFINGLLIIESYLREYMSDSFILYQCNQIKTKERLISYLYYNKVVSKFLTLISCLRIIEFVKFQNREEYQVVWKFFVSSKISI